MIYQRSPFATAFVSESVLNFNPVIVIGAPRSGTSVIARILQEDFGVMMDEGPIKKDAHNPNGYYEDERLVKMNKQVLKRWMMGSNNEQRMDMAWANQFAIWVTMRAFKYERWGFKEPRMLGFIQWALQFVNEPVFIWPIRTDEQIIKSQVEKLGYPPMIAKAGVEAYKTLIERHIGDKVHKIDLSERGKRNEILDQIHRILDGCRANR